jgi:hypothetical protein
MLKVATVVCAAYLSPSLVGHANAQAPAQDTQTSPNPACALLSTAEVRRATAKNYDDGSEGDALGEGAGGGASCQWGVPSFRPGADLPLLSLVFIPKPPNGSHTEKALKAKPFPGCTRETLRGIGDLAFVETCERSRGPVAYVKTGPNDLIVQADPEEGKPLASAKPVIIAVAKAAAVKARGR